MIRFVMGLSIACLLMGCSEDTATKDPVKDDAKEEAAVTTPAGDEAVAKEEAATPAGDQVAAKEEAKDEGTPAKEEVVATTVKFNVPGMT